MATRNIITLTAIQIKELYNLLGGDEHPNTEITIGTDDETGEGLFCWFTDNPEEGAFNL